MVNIFFLPSSNQSAYKLLGRSVHNHNFITKTRMVFHHKNNIHNSFLVAVNYECRINCAFYVSTTMNLQMLKEEITSYRLQSRKKSQRCMVSQACLRTLGPI